MEKTKVKNGKVWVKDVRAKGGGYWRKLKRVGGAIASQILGAAVVGAGVAAVTSQAIKKGGKEAGVTADKIAKTFGSQVNKGAIAGAAVGGLVAGAAGTAAMANRRRGNAYRQSMVDPWESPVPSNRSQKASTEPIEVKAEYVGYKTDPDAPLGYLHPDGNFYDHPPKKKRRKST